MKVAVQVRRARLGGRVWRVICPAGGTDNAGLWTNDYWQDVYVDRLRERIHGDTYGIRVEYRSCWLAAV